VGSVPVRQVMIRFFSDLIPLVLLGSFMGASIGYFGDTFLTPIVGSGGTWALCLPLTVVTTLHILRITDDYETAKREAP
jgi:hypothetical protein